MIVRKHYYISGSVQGVGFRYRAYYLAGAMGLTGYAKNLYDGRVELEIQGEGSAVRDFLSKIQEGRFIYITDMECKDMEPQLQERQFDIR